MTRSALRNHIGWAVLAAGGASALALWPQVPPQLAPTLVSGMFILVLAYAWNLVGGILGELSLGTMVFWAIGAYALVLAGNNDVSIGLAVVLAVIVAALFGWAIVAIAGWLGLQGLYLAVFSLIVYEVARSIVVGQPALGGNEGLLYAELTSADVAVYGLIGLVIVVIAANMSVLRSRLGKRWLSIKDDVVAAEAVGVYSAREKARAYALSGGLAALGGAVQAYYIGFAQPETALSLDLLIVAILAVYVGGPGTVSGPFLGVALVYGLSAVATNLSTSIEVALYAQLAQYALAFVIIYLLSAGHVSRVGLMAGLAAALRRFRPARRSEPPPAPVGLPDAEIPSASVRAAVTGGDQHVLEVRAVSKRFGAAQVLREVSLDLRAGEIVGLMGPNGAGKTTLCNVITGVVDPDEGSVWLEGRNLTGRSTPARFHDGIARTFQAARLFTSLSIRDNVAIAASGPEQVPELLDRYGLVGDEPAVGAPTFVRRLTEVARALATDKRVLILDEPLAGLTGAQHKLILDSLREVAATGTSVVLVEHLIEAVAPVCARLVVMVEGAIIADGLPSDVLRDERVVDAYLGTTAAVEKVPDAAER